MNPKKYHLFICGITGSGKTTLATKIYENLDTICIFINTNEERIPERASQIIIYDSNEFIEAIELNATKICLNPREFKEIETSEIERITKILMTMGRERKKEGIFAHIFIDEVQEYSSLHKPNINIDRIWKRGRRYGIIGCAISQRPADVSHTILTQSQFHVIFKLGTYETPYFERYKIPIEEHKEWLKKPYHIIVFDGVEVKRYYPIKLETIS